MKKLFLVAALALVGLNMNAQDKESKGLQGVWWAGGQVSFSKTETATTESKSTTVIPVVGYFVSPNVTIGLGIGSMSSKTETTASPAVTTSESNTFIVQPLVRKYWGIGGKFFFFGQAALPVTFSKDKLSDDKTTSFGLDLAPGFDFIVNKWMTVETSFSLINVSSTTRSPKVGDSTSDFNFTANPFDLNPSGASRTAGGLRLGVKFLF